MPDDKALHEEALAALEYWSNTITMSLRGKFGKGRLGHILILFDFGKHGRTFHWASDAKRHSVIDTLRHLADHIESTDSKIILPEGTKLH